MLDRLGQPLPLSAMIPNALEPTVMDTTPEAQRELISYHDEVEILMGQLGPDNPKLDLINKSPEFSMRVAATLERVENPNATRIGIDSMRAGIEVARYYRAEAVQLGSAPDPNPVVERAKTLTDFFKEKGIREFNRTWLTSCGPHSLRPKRVLDPIISLLVECGWLMKIDDPKRPGGGRTRTVYRLTTAAMRELGMSPR